MGWPGWGLLRLLSMAASPFPSPPPPPPRDIKRAPSLAGRRLGSEGLTANAVNAPLPPYPSLAAAKGKHAGTECRGREHTSNGLRGLMGLEGRLHTMAQVERFVPLLRLKVSSKHHPPGLSGLLGSKVKSVHRMQSRLLAERTVSRRLL